MVKEPRIKSPGRKSGDTGWLGVPGFYMARWAVFIPGAPRLPPGACMRSSKPEAQARGIRDGSHRYPAVSLWKRAGLMPNTRLNAREN
jgi:hypothetical protein